MSDLTDIILTIPEIEAARISYGLPSKFSNARLREYIALMEAQHKKSYGIIMAEASRQLHKIAIEWERPIK